MSDRPSETPAATDLPTDAPWHSRGHSVAAAAPVMIDVLSWTQAPMAALVKALLWMGAPEPQQREAWARDIFQRLQGVGYQAPAARRMLREVAARVGVPLGDDYAETLPSLGSGLEGAPPRVRMAPVGLFDHEITANDEVVEAALRFLTCDLGLLRRSAHQARAVVDAATIARMRAMSSLEWTRGLRYDFESLVGVSATRDEATRARAEAIATAVGTSAVTGHPIPQWDIHQALFGLWRDDLTPETWTHVCRIAREVVPVELYTALWASKRMPVGPRAAPTPRR